MVCTYRTFAPGARQEAAAYAAHLLEKTLAADRMAQAVYYTQGQAPPAEQADAMGSIPLVRADLDPALAAALGLRPNAVLAPEQLAHVLGGRRADGEEIERASHQNAQVRTYEDTDGHAVRHRVAGLDLTFSAPKGLSVAWAMAATDAERWSLLQAHRDAVTDVLHYVEREIGLAQGGKARSGPEEPARLAWITIEHFTARPTVEITRPDPVTGVVGTELYVVQAGDRVRGDPQLHTHTIVPNLMVAESGRLVAVNRDALAGRIHEFGAVYHAMLATQLRRLGVEVALCERTLTARLPAIPEAVCEAFSHRSQNGAAAARAFAAEAGLDWDSLDAERKVALLKSGTQNHKLPKDFALTPEGQEFGRAARRDDLADFAAWAAQAARIGFRHETVLTTAPVEPEADAAERAKAGWWAALPVLERELDARAVVKVADARIAAARGLIASGAAETADVDRVLARLASQGVRQQGRWTEVLAPAGVDNPQARLTTGLHRDQEAEVIRLVQAAAQDMRFALTPETLRAVTAGQDFSTAIGREQKRAIGRVGVGGAVSVFIGVGGSGKSTRVLPPLVTAYRQQGREVWGTAQAWEQANRLAEAGIDPLQTFALKPFLDGLREGSDRPLSIQRGAVVMVDEFSQIGTRELLDLLRAQQRHGFKLILTGDERQCQAQPLHARVLTPTGWRQMGELRAGDLVTCPDGSTASITAVQEQGEKDIWRVRFSDGRAVECCLDHLWKVWRAQPVYSRGSHTERKVINKGGGWTVLPLSEIKRWFDNRYSKTKLASVPVVLPGKIELPAQDLPIPPYTLGLLLGDGHFAKSIVHYCTADTYLINRISEQLPAYEAVPYGKYHYRLKLRNKADHLRGKIRFAAAETTGELQRKGRRKGLIICARGQSKTIKEWSEHTGIPAYRLWDRVVRHGWPADEALGFEPRSTNHSPTFSPLSLALRAMGLEGARSETKFIPEIYKQGSVAQRRGILQGLMDTDGTVGSGGTYGRFHSVSIRLAKDVQEVAWSLGAIASIGSCDPGPSRPLRLYRVYIRCPEAGDLFELPRKQQSTRPNPRELRLRITSVEPAEAGPARCIMVDHPDHLYVSDGYVVTHNSISAGPIIELLAEALGARDIPEILTAIRQSTERERKIAALFRGERGDGPAERLAAVTRAIGMKREDGTAELVPGDREAIIRRAAEAYMEACGRGAHDPDYRVTVSAPTNTDAHEISLAIRALRREAGQVGRDLVVVDAWMVPAGSTRWRSPPAIASGSTGAPMRASETRAGSSAAPLPATTAPC